MFSRTLDDTRNWCRPSLENHHSFKIETQLWMVFFQIQSSDEMDYIFVNWGYFSGVLFLPCDYSFGGFSSVVRFFTHNSDFGLFLFWFTLVVMCTFWWTRDSSYICWIRIDPYCFLFAWCHMLLRWTNWRPILWIKWVVVEYKSDPLLNVDGAFFRHLILILILWFVWTLFLLRTYSLFWQVAWFSKGVRVMLNACIIWPTDEYFTDKFWVSFYVISSKNWFFKKWLLHQWVYFTACFLSWPSSCIWCVTICIFLTSVF